REALKDSITGGLSLIKLVRRMSALEEHVIDTQNIHLTVAIKYSIKILEKSFKQKKIKLVMDVPDRMTVLAELVSLTNSVLNNLLTNAHKFSYRRSKVWITAIEKGDSIELSIRDEGIGIPQEMHDKLFSIGMAKNRKGTNQEQGTGFGMPLVRKFMLAYGGNIRFESTDEKENPDQKGTTMILTFIKGK
ncbi:MAG: sensor histidine kinase, partial [Proteobacteria bacterium]|nr:sensor histidine kinase [Pseudomonadota bacterium]